MSLPSLLQRFPDISSLRRGYADRVVSPSEVVATLAPVIRENRLNAYLADTGPQAEVRARELERRLAEEGDGAFAALPLFGVPVSVKDNLQFAGHRMTCASRMLANYRSPFTATAVERLEAAGAIVVGKTNLDEFAMGGSNENSAFGPVLHPTHPERVPGGSSGGAAAAVREGSCWVSLGSDTGGSIRLPASFCGVSGLKPTYGRVSRNGLVAFASSLDQVGPLARSVEDLALTMDALAAHDPLDPTSSPRAAGPFSARFQALTDSSRSPWGGLRIGVPDEFLSAPGLDGEVADAIESALKRLEARGARRVPLKLPLIRHGISVYYLCAVSEASSNLSRFDGVRFGERPAGATTEGFYEAARDAFGPEVKRRILLGAHALSAGYYDAYFRKAGQVRELLCRDFERAFGECDVILGPVAPTTAFLRGEQTQDPLRMYLNDLFTVAANLAGLPALSTPCGTDRQGLPIGLQWMGPRHSDELLLGLAGRFEREEGGRA